MTDLATTEEAFGERSRRRLKLALQAVCLATLAASLVLGVQFVRKALADESEKRAELQRITEEAAAQIDRILKPVGQATTDLAARLTRGEVDAANVEPALRAMVQSHEAFFGGTVAFRPYGRDPDTRLYAPYFTREAPASSPQPTQLGDDYDYTQPAPGALTDWYVKPMAEGGRDGWSPPYFDRALSKTLITHSAIFMSAGPAPQKNGVVTLDVSMDRLKQIIRDLRLGPGGFGALTTSEGVYLYHPDERLVRQRKTLEQVAQERHDPNRLALATAAAERRSGIMTHRSTTTGARSWLAYAPVPSTGWSLQITYVRNDVPRQVQEVRRQGIWIVVTLTGFLASLSLLLLRAHEGRTPRLWAGTAAVSLLLLTGIGTVWYLALNHHAPPGDNGQARAFDDRLEITDRTVLLLAQERFDRQRRERKQDGLTYLPTGLHIESMDLDSSNTVAVAGQIWQKVPLDAAAAGPRGLVFHGATDVRVTPIESRTDAADRFVVQRSSFQFKLRTQFDFSRYPLEIERIRIGIDPAERGRSQALVPDLDSYDILLASQKPGLEPGLQLRGWTIESTSFVLRPRSQNSRFGQHGSVDLEPFPELVFEIGLKRIFVDAFISNLTPLIVVAIVLFSLLLLPDSVGIKEILGFCVSLFFVVVFAHLSIRRSIASGQIFYLEYFFLVTYFALLLVPINAFRRALQVPYPLLEYRGGLLTKVLYWPLTLGIFFLITLLKFY
jgi:hypothetical protein